MKKTYVILLTLLSVILFSQKITIKGTSTLHDFEVYLDQYQYDSSTHTFKANVDNIYSDNKKMTKIMANAFSKKDISFKPTSHNVSGDQVTINGNLTLNGVTKPITVKGVAKNGILTGTYKLNHLDYNVPIIKALLGTIKVDPNLELDFKLKERQ